MSKLITKFVMVALAVLACATLTACGDDKDDPEPIDYAPSLAGTVWVESNYYSDGSVMTQTISFSGSSATLRISYREGTEEVSSTYTYNYSSDESETKAATLVAMRPIQAGNATLEGRIENFLKMTVINMSNNEQVGVFYRQ